MSTPQQQEALFQEGRLILAVQAYKQGQFRGLLTATKVYNVPRSTAQLRVKGIQPKCGSIAPNCCLTPVQEESLKQWILLMGQRGMLLKIATVRQMADILVTQHAGFTTPKPID